MGKLALLSGAVVLFFLGALESEAFAEQTRFVDYQRALSETQEGRRALKSMKSLYERRQAELDKMQKRLKKMEGEMEKLGPLLSKAAKVKRAEAFQKLFVELQSKHVEYQREIADRQAKATGKILERMGKIMAEIGERDSLTTILEVTEGGVVFHQKSLDLTNELIQIYDRRHPVKGAKSSGRTKAAGRSKTTSKSRQSAEK